MRARNASTDPELKDWIQNASIDGGAFLRSIAIAAMHAVAPDQYEWLRPLLLDAKVRYPEFSSHAYQQKPGIMGDTTCICGKPQWHHLHIGQAVTVQLGSSGTFLPPPYGDHL